MPYHPLHPATERFHAISLSGGGNWAALKEPEWSEQLQTAANEVPRGQCVFYGLPFYIGESPLMLGEGDQPATLPLDLREQEWLVLAHTCDYRPGAWAYDPLVARPPGDTHLGAPVASYHFIYADGDEVPAELHVGEEIGLPCTGWGVNCTQARPHGICNPMPNQAREGVNWGWAQMRVTPDFQATYTHWLWAWRNPHPERRLKALRVEPRQGRMILAGISAGRAGEHPLRWHARQSAVLTLPAGTTIDPDADEEGLHAHARLDMGQVIALRPRLQYPREGWAVSPANELPQVGANELLVDFTAHPDATFHLADGRRLPVAGLRDGVPPLQAVRPATQRVKLRVVERAGGRPVACRLHAHGEAGEYLPPLDRHREPNGNFNEDTSADYLHDNLHLCSYIDGETELRLPIGGVYIEISKGFEIRPIRRRYEIHSTTSELTIELDRVLDWEARGWRSADTHVHFVSPQTGLLEGAAEGVHVVNLLASQWGECLTNVGDFDGQTTHASEDGGGRYFLRVGTENRQHVLGHISLVGYDGPPILPLCVGGPSESGFGEPVSVLITEWARRCREQNGLAVMPHWPRPRLENAATLVAGEADAVEFCSWDRFYDGIDPYSLADWYRFLNNGYFTPAVGGTDKMAAVTAVGTLRSYARLPSGHPFTYESWKEAIRRGETFVTNGPMLDMQVDGHRIGSRWAMPSGAGGTVSVSWRVASVTIPMTAVELIANGEVIDGSRLTGDDASGTFEARIEGSTWLALLVRGKYRDHEEIVAAHSSPVMIEVPGKPFCAAADAMTILRQIEGAMAYLDSIATPAEAERMKQMRLMLTGIHRDLHNRMHQQGVYHQHTPTTDHSDHH